MEDQSQKLMEEKLKIENQFKAGANWFFWIAGLSLINSVIVLSGSEWSFIIGLGITQIFDSIGLITAEEIGFLGKILAFILNCCVAGFFVFFGVFARKKCGWAFIIGMVLYALDGLLFLLVQDFLSLGFHVFASVCIYKGFDANKKLSIFSESQIPQIQPESTLNESSEQHRHF